MISVKPLCRFPIDTYLTLVDWHNASRRQFVVNLSAEVEITVSDGETRRFGAGTILLAEDVSGKGHISRGVGNAERLSIFVPLVDRK